MARDSEPPKLQSTVLLRVDGERFGAAEGSEHRDDAESKAGVSQPPKTHNRDAARSMANDSEPTK